MSDDSNQKKITLRELAGVALFVLAGVLVLILIVKGLVEGNSDLILCVASEGAMILGAWIASSKTES